MRTEQRLTRAYENARVEPFDNDSKYVFFSDVHRGTGSLADEFTRNRIIYLHALEDYYKKGFTYVEAGDGDELWESMAFEKNKIAHFEVYKAMKDFFDDGRLIMLYGNHNIYLRHEKFVNAHYHSYYDEAQSRYVDLFVGLVPCEALLLRHKATGQEILTIHGHQGDISNDQLWRLSMFSMKFWRLFHSVGIQNPSSPVKNVNKQLKIERNYKKWIAKNKHMLICGHTHRFRFPRAGELPYFNTGSCVYPATITAIELEGGCVSLVRWQVFANDEGFLRVTKIVLAGPTPVSEFDIR